MAESEPLSGHGFTNTRPVEYRRDLIAASEKQRESGWEDLLPTLFREEKKNFKCVEGARMPLHCTSFCPPLNYVSKLVAERAPQPGGRLGRRPDRPADRRGPLRLAPAPVAVPELGALLHGELERGGRNGGNNAERNMHVARQRCLSAAVWSRNLGQELVERDPGRLLLGHQVRAEHPLPDRLAVCKTVMSMPMGRNVNLLIPRCHTVPLKHATHHKHAREAQQIGDMMRQR